MTTRGQLLSAISTARYRTLVAYQGLRRLTESLEADDIDQAKLVAHELSESIPAAIDELESVDYVLSEKTRLRK